MSEYTPTTDEVRDAFRWGGHYNYVLSNRVTRGLKFDRWLASVKAEAWDERHKMDPCVTGVAKNPYREETK